MIDYCLELKAIKLYNLNFCTKTFALCKNLPLSNTEKVDQNKGGL